MLVLENGLKYFWYNRPKRPRKWCSYLLYSDLFIGAGGALLIGNKFESTRRYSYSTTPWTFYIANQGISRAQSTKNMVVTHTGIYPFRGRRELAAPGNFDDSEVTMKIFYVR